MHRNQVNYLIYCDSQSVIDLRKNALCHSKTKHISVRFHWIKYIIDRRLMYFNKIHTDNNQSNTITKIMINEKTELCKKIKFSHLSYMM